MHIMDRADAIDSTQLQTAWPQYQISVAIVWDISAPAV